MAWKSTGRLVEQLRLTLLAVTATPDAKRRSELRRLRFASCSCDQSCTREGGFASAEPAKISAKRANLNGEREIPWGEGQDRTHGTRRLRAWLNLAPQMLQANSLHLTQCNFVLCPVI